MSKRQKRIMWRLVPTASRLIQFTVGIIDRVRLRFPLRPCRFQRGLVSVPIATYDRIEVLIERTLPALLAQTYSNLEVIVVGDGTKRRV